MQRQEGVADTTIDFYKELFTSNNPCNFEEVLVEIP